MNWLSDTSFFLAAILISANSAFDLNLTWRLGLLDAIDEYHYRTIGGKLSSPISSYFWDLYT